MADSVIQNQFDLANRYNKNTTSEVDPTVNRWGEKDEWEAKTEDKGTLSFTDMLQLMVAQFQNQTMDNQASTTDMMNQLVQMSSMQAMTEMSTQIQELTLANVMGYAASLVGQTVTLGIYNENTKQYDEIVGVVEGAGTYDGNQVIFVGGKSYLLSSIMAVGTLPPKVDETQKPDESGDKTDTGNTDDKVEQTPDAGTEDTGSAEEGDKVSGADGGEAVG